MATTDPIELALATLRERRLALYEATRQRNIAFARNRGAGNIADMNDAIAAARAAWISARAAVVVALLEA